MADRGNLADRFSWQRNCWFMLLGVGAMVNVCACKATSYNAAYVRSGFCAGAFAAQADCISCVIGRCPS